MKNAVYVHKDYTKLELVEMTKNAVIAFDTNVLLDFYSYSSKTLDDIERILTKDGVKNRLFVPYHVAQEFFKNENSVIKKSENKYTSKIGAITAAVSSLVYGITQSHFLHDWVVLSKEKLEKVVEDIQADYAKMAFKGSDISERIERIFTDETVGIELCDIESYEDKFERRLKYDLPPGTTDRQKEQNKSGDYLIWCELLLKAETDKTDIIFITNERKFDWWEPCDDGMLPIKMIPSRHLLIEFNKKTKQRCYFYNMSQFIKYLAINLGEKIGDIEIRSAEDESEQVIIDNAVAHEENVADATSAG